MLKQLIRTFILTCLFLTIASLPVLAGENGPLLDPDCVKEETDKRFDDFKITDEELNEIEKTCVIINGDDPIGGNDDLVNGNNDILILPESKSLEQQFAEDYIAGGGVTDGRIPGQHPECNIYVKEGTRIDVLDSVGNKILSFTYDDFFLGLSDAARTAKTSESETVFFGPVTLLAGKVTVSASVTSGIDFDFNEEFPEVLSVEEVRIVCTVKDATGRSKTRITILKDFTTDGATTVDAPDDSNDPEDLQDDDLEL